MPKATAVRATDPLDILYRGQFRPTRDPEADHNETARISASQIVMPEAEERLIRLAELRLKLKTDPEFRAMVQKRRLFDEERGQQSFAARMNELSRLAGIDHAETVSLRDTDGDSSDLNVAQASTRIPLNHVEYEFKNTVGSRARKVSKLRKGNGESTRLTPAPEFPVPEDARPPHYDPEFARDFAEFL